MIYLYSALAYLVFSYLYWTAISTGFDNKSSLVKKWFPETYWEYWLFESRNSDSYSSSKHHEAKLNIFFYGFAWFPVLAYLLICALVKNFHKAFQWFFSGMWRIVESASEPESADKPTTF